MLLSSSFMVPLVVPRLVSVSDSSCEQRGAAFRQSVRGDIIYDPFLGSGTTLVAAHSTERFCFGLDIDPRYVDMTVLRWQKFTRQVAVLAADGRTFDQVMAERAVVEVA